MLGPWDWGLGDVMECLLDVGAGGETSLPPFAQRPLWLGEQCTNARKNESWERKTWNTHLFDFCRLSYFVSYCFGVFLGRDGIPGVAFPGFILS
eukprot:3113798-Amphidinium_carterae.1